MEEDEEDDQPEGEVPVALDWDEPSTPCPVEIAFHLEWCPERRAPIGLEAGIGQHTQVHWASLKTT